MAKKIKDIYEEEFRCEEASWHLRWKAAGL